MSDNAWQRRWHAARAQPRRQLIATLLSAADGGCDRSRKLAGKLCSCGRYPVVYARPDGRLFISPARCKSRLCPTCGPHRIQALEARLATILQRVDDARLLTLTVRSSVRPLREQLDDLNAAFSRLRRHAAWRAHVTGGVKIVEITWSQKLQMWHPHLHVVLDGTFWPQKSIAAAWSTCTGEQSIVDIRRISSRAAVVKYVAKYVSKTQQPKDLPSARVVEWCNSVHGLRMAQTFGRLHGVEADHDDAEQQGPAEHVASMAALAEDAERGSLRARRLIRSVQLVTRRWLLSHPRTDARHRSVRRRLSLWNDYRPGERPPGRPPPRWHQMPLHEIPPPHTMLSCPDANSSTSPATC